MGLSIAKTFVEAHGEQIWVDDVPEGGARFAFTLPRCRRQRRQAITEMAKVLVVDDDSSLLRAMRLGLQAGGHQVITAANGEQGISRPPCATPDVVVLDLGLPDIDGLAVCKRIRQWSDVPIIILSASGTEDRKVAALDGGADDYVTKPFGMAELEARIALRCATVRVNQRSRCLRTSRSACWRSTSCTTKLDFKGLPSPSRQRNSRCCHFWHATWEGRARTR